MLRYIKSETVDRVATVTLNRPEKRNALSSEMLVELESTLLVLDKDPDVDVLILTGAGTAFCAGLDMNELSHGGENMRTSDPDGQIGPIPLLSKPLIGAVNGAAITGGFEIAMLCDIVVASEQARFGDTHARIGLLPDWGLSVILPHLVGTKKSIELFLTGNFVTAQEALALGLINHVVPQDALMTRAQALARDIVSNDQRAVRELLRLQRHISRARLHEGLRLEAEFAAAWQGGGVDGAEINERKAGVMERNKQRGAL
jgi:enoyl-CoA hydratase